MLPEEGDLAASEVMTKNVIVVDKKETVQKAAMLLRKNNIRGLPVVSDNKVVGIITDKDIISKVVAENKSARDVLVDDVMAPKIITAEPDESITDIAKRMYANNIGRIPIVDKKGNLLGIVTETDITKIAPGLIDVLYEHGEIEMPVPVKKRGIIEGRCEECGQVYDDLVEVSGQWLCRSCSEDKTVVGSRKISAR